MTLNNIEEVLGVELPDDYKNLITNYPKKLLAKGFNAAEVELLKSPDKIVELNKYVQGILDIESSFFLIGESGCGDYYFIDLDEEDSPVYFWNHDISDFDDDEESGSLLEHAGNLLESYTYIVENT